MIIPGLSILLFQTPADSFFHKYNLAMIIFSVLFFLTRAVVGERRKWLERKAAAAAEKKVDTGRDGGGETTEEDREGGQKKIMRHTDGHDNPISVEED